MIVAAASCAEAAVQVESLFGWTVRPAESFLGVADWAAGLFFIQGGWNIGFVMDFPPVDKITILHDSFPCQWNGAGSLDTGKIPRFAEKSVPRIISAAQGISRFIKIPLLHGNVCRWGSFLHRSSLVAPPISCHQVRYCRKLSYRIIANAIRGILAVPQKMR